MDSIPSSQTIRKNKSLVRSTSLVSSMTLISRVMGFVRDMVIAHFFGAVAGVDAYLVAFKIPNFMRRLFAEGAFSQAFVPVLSEYQETRSNAEVRQFLSHIAGSLGSILFLVTVVAVLCAPLLVLIFAPGFGYHSVRFAMATDMLRITFPYLLFISLTAMVGAVLNTYGSFGVPAFTPVLLNVSLIGAAIYLSRFFETPVYALAWGVFIAGVAQLLFQLPFLHKQNLFVRPSVALRDPGVRKVLKLMMQALFGVSVAQINLLLDTIFASFLKVGSVSWLYYSNQLSNFPLGVFGVAIATVILPHLSRKHADKSPQAFSEAVDWGFRWIILVGLPAAVGLFVLAGPTIATLFNYGVFSSYDVRMARLSLMAFSFGLPAFMLIKVFASAFYARQNIKTPVKIGVVAMLTNMFLNLLLIKPLAHAGLALATSLSAFLNAGLLFYYLRQGEVYDPQAGWGIFLLRVGLASFAMLILLAWGSPNLNQWLAWGWSDRVLRLSLLIIAAMISYLIALYVLGLRFNKLRSPS